MSDIKISINQINTKVGSLHSNTTKIVQKIIEASNKNCDIVCFPELSITGYPPEDLVLSDTFINNNIHALNQIIDHTNNITAIVGFIDKKNDEIYNSAAVISDRKLIAVYRKNKLPNYGVFDEKRYFSSGNQIITLNNKNIKIGISICEDIWEDFEVCKLQSDLGCNLLININGSPFDKNKKLLREKLLSNVSKECNAHLVYVNAIGGQDELVFDGSSMVYDFKGEKIMSMPSFKEKSDEIQLCLENKKTMSSINEYDKKFEFIEKDISINNHKKIVQRKKIVNSSTNEDILNALILGTKDYAEKNNFDKCLVSLSGGIDSALVTVIACEAMGSENVKAVTLPSKYSSSHSISDSEELCENLGLDLEIIPIMESHKSMLNSLENLFIGTKENNAEENLQARIRGNFIMAISNKFSWLVLSTGNKSEIATGYATLYGDMAGGFSVLKDVPKTMVYDLSNFINTKKEIIPKNIIKKPPSAELKPDQYDQDTLPDYNTLDMIIELYVEKKESFKKIISNKEIRKNISEEKILEILKMIDRNEYKRRQSPPGIKITSLAFGRDRRYPLASDHKYTYTDY
ncbi:MAG: NAD+ synthase [Dehalococcoidia bacterium]|nr:NAD+ synthase [Chloroflexota bacterium]RZP13067.1 MAG: NAD+ synthase [Chloroflexota bacterium]|tara:strand:+ start:31471 stop:33195 length:1725 start_codon:yes stop_codon:yes gene_type:complete